MPHRSRTHRHEAVGNDLSPKGHSPLDQALIENSELKLLLFKTFATLSTYASGFSDGGAQARKKLDTLHHRMYIGTGHDHDYRDHRDDDGDDSLETDTAKTPLMTPPSRRVS